MALDEFNISDLHEIYPVYSTDLILEVNGGQGGIPHDYTIGFDVYINRIVNNYTFYDLIDSFKTPISKSRSKIDLSPILATQITSDAYTAKQSGLTEFISNGIRAYYVDAKAYDENNQLVTGTSTGIKYIFNGCADITEDFEMSNFIMSSGNSGKFLTNYNSSRNITINGTAYLQTITGDYGTGLASNISGFRITRYQSDLSSSGITSSWINNTDKRIININLSPDSINYLYPDFINDDTEYIVVNELGGYNTNTIKTIIIKEHKLKKFYNFIYTNRLGGTDYFSAVKVSDNTFKYKKKYLNQYYDKKLYNNEIKRTTSVLTQFMTSSQSDGLKELFSSPAIKLQLDGNLYDVNILNKRAVVRDRYPKNSLIQYEIEFEYNNKKFIQQQ